MHYAYV